MAQKNSKANTVTLTADQFKERFAGVFQQDSFTNEHGEVFEVYVTQTSVFIAGDETDWKVLPLFNPQFNIWSLGELRFLGTTIAKLAERMIK